MHSFSQKYTLAHTISDLPDGYEYSMKDWPLHITLADVFAIDGDPGSLLKDIATRLRTYIPVRAEVVDDEWFGEDKSVHVRLLNKTPELQELHETILRVLDGYYVVFNHPEYNGSGFRPHATVQLKEQLALKDVVTFGSITLIDMYPDENPYRRRVIGTIHFIKR
ncbi:MAG: hypothetical protein JWP06_580 [Candidatus Saccharibacteria bacterium]|jgi:2'-5' RNA ligase|nr:hypothetical protein [Candidatus Saccharibacteria bacterium]